jgi:multidrug resistance efflux pump
MAAACSYVPLSTYEAWKKTEDFQSELARAKSDYIEAQIAKAEAEPKGWQRFTWMLERSRTYRDLFPAIAPSNTQSFSFNQLNQLHSNQHELEDARKRLDETKALQDKRQQSVQEAQEAEGEAG